MAPSSEHWNVEPDSSAEKLKVAPVLFVSAAGAPVFSAQAAGLGYTVRTVDGDELGRFTLAEVPAGRCRLEVSNGEIVLRTDLDLTA